MTPIDLALALAGRAHAALDRDGHEPRRAQLVIVALVALTAVPLLVIALTPIPAEISFEGLRRGEYATRESWLRLEGDLRAAEDPTGRSPYAYTLHDEANEELAVTILADRPLPTGHAEVTGRPLGGVRVDGTFEAFYADVPTEPARHDPWWLIALPALVAGMLLVGARTGYPVLRPEAPRASAGEPFGAGEGVAARWSGRIGTESVPAGIPRAARIGLTCDGEACELEVTDERGVHRLAIRRGSPMQVGRLCRIGGCVPGLRIHAPGADVTLEPATAVDRDRLAALLR